MTTPPCAVGFTDTLILASATGAAPTLVHESVDTFDASTRVGACRFSELGALFATASVSESRPSASDTVQPSGNPLSKSAQAKSDAPTPLGGVCSSHHVVIPLVPPLPVGLAPPVPVEPPVPLVPPLAVAPVPLVPPTPPVPPVLLALPVPPSPASPPVAVAPLPPELEGAPQIGRASCRANVSSEKTPA